jgi:predicted AlkP superfamily pyrophosphatase or phosphodiesterase
MRATFATLTAALALVILAACTASNENAPSNQPGKVLIIGMDGTRAQALDVADMPNLNALRAKAKAAGTETLNAITGDVSLSGPGWSSLNTGVWCDKHGVIDNDMSFANNRFRQYPPFITRVEKTRPELRTVSISHWAPINTRILCAVESLDDCGRADKVVNSGSDAGTRDFAVDELTKNNPDAMFLQFDDIDENGHGEAPERTYQGGFCPFASGNNELGQPDGNCTVATFNQGYLDAMHRVDGYIGDILNALYRRPNFLAENWLVMVSPDHGGGGMVFNQHGFPVAQDRRTFLISSTQRSKPFPTNQQLRIVDVGVSALYHLRIPIDPAWDLDGLPVGLAGAPDYVPNRPIPSCLNPGTANADLGHATGTTTPAVLIGN